MEGVVMVHVQLTNTQWNPKLDDYVRALLDPADEVEVENLQMKEALEQALNRAGKCVSEIKVKRPRGEIQWEMIS